jgi:hypothetical protein
MTYRKLFNCLLQLISCHYSERLIIIIVYIIFGLYYIIMKV